MVLQVFALPNTLGCVAGVCALSIPVRNQLKRLPGTSMASWHAAADGLTLQRARPTKLSLRCCLVAPSVGC
eukprot:4671216-Amphidinium_carterae.1